MDRFLSESAQSDMTFVIKNISNFKSFFHKAIQEYNQLNTRIFTDLIAFHLHHSQNSSLS